LYARGDLRYAERLNPLSLQSAVHGVFGKGRRMQSPRACASKSEDVNMLKPTRARLAAVFLGAVVAIACGDEAPDTESPIDLVRPGAIDAGAAAADSGPVATSDAGASSQDAGGTLRPVDAGAPARDAASPVATNDAGDAGASDAGASDTGASDGGGGPSADGGSLGTSCCTNADCLCRGANPTALVSSAGPYKTMSYEVAGAGLVFYPTDAEPPFAAVTLSDGAGGEGGARGQTASWGPFYASHGIVAMIVFTTGGDQPPARGMKLNNGITALKAENTKSGSPLFGKLAGRYGTSGYSMGGGGTTYAATRDPMLKSSIGLAAWQPVGTGVTVPTLFICGESDTTAPCRMASGAYGQMPATTPKMWVEVSGGHGTFGRPTAGEGRAGSYALAFQKVFLEGDERWRPILVGAMSNATTIK
jgi:hypothetical protein